MAHAYTPGLKVTRRITHRARRMLPISGDVLLKREDRVKARDVVAQTFMPGDITPLNLANLLSVSPGDAPACMLKHEGHRVAAGEVLARSKGLFGFFHSEYKASVSGTIESVSSITGQVILRGEPRPVQVLAFLPGTVVEVIPNEGVVIEADVSYIQGIFGIGGEAFGPLRMACRSHDQELTAELITPEMRGAVVVGGARMTGDAVRRAIEVGASAVVSGGMDDQDLNEILGYDLGVAITGSERIGTTVIITEGFGEIAMAVRTFELLSSRAGDEASVNGATQIRAGVMRPEIVIPLSQDEQAETPEDPHTAGMLEVGMPVRIIRDPHFGLIGQVESLPPEPRELASGSKARVLAVRTETGENLIVPRANVELIER